MKVCVVHSCGKQLRFVFSWPCNILALSLVTVRRQMAEHHGAWQIAKWKHACSRNENMYFLSGKMDALDKCRELRCTEHVHKNIFLKHQKNLHISNFDVRKNFEFLFLFLFEWKMLPCQQPNVFLSLPPTHLLAPSHWCRGIGPVSIKKTRSSPKSRKRADDKRKW